MAQIEDMHNRVDWLQPADISILRVLGPPNYFELTTGNIARNAGVSTNWTSQRLTVLNEKGMVESEGNGHPYYWISDFGKRFLQGEVSVDELRDLSSADEDDR